MEQGVDGNGIGDFTERLAVARQLGRAGDPAAALAIASTLAAAAEGADLGQALLRVAWNHLQLGQSDDGLAAAAQARRIFKDLQLWDRLASATSLYAWLLLETGLTDEAYTDAERALAMAREFGEPLTLAHALSSKGTALLYAQQAELAIPLFREAIAIAVRIADRSAQSLFLSNLAFAQAALADDAAVAGKATDAARLRATAVAIGDEAIAAARLAGDGWMLRLALANTAEYLGIVGRLDEARGLLAEWSSASGRPGTRDTIHYLYTEGELLMRLGQLPEANKACAEALRLAEASGHTDHQMNCLRRLAEIAEAAGDWQAAFTTFRRYHDVYRRNEGELAKRRAAAAQIRFESERHRAEAQRLAAEVLRDPLTGIANRRAFEQRLASIGDASYAIAIIDIDHFKSINDRYSHQHGDAVLVRVAATLDDWSTPDRLVARLGGEEFVVLFSGDRRAAAGICETMRQAVAGVEFPHPNGAHHVTISIGVAFAAPGEGSAGVMARADERLYSAKAGGRDRVVAGDDPVNA